MGLGFTGGNARHARGSPGRRTSVGLSKDGPSWTCSNIRRRSSSRTTAFRCHAASSPTPWRRCGRRREQLTGRVVVKAQVKTGGRGKAGGVKVADDAADAVEKATAILGMDIKGHTVHKVLVEEASAIAEEYYFSFLLDRANRTFLAICSAAGGMDIEEVAHSAPEKVAKVPVSALTGVDRAKAREIAPGRRAAGEGARRRRRAHREALVRLRRRGRHAGRGQPDDPVGRRPGEGARRQGHSRRQRRLPPAGARGVTPTSPAEDPLEAKAKEKDLNYVKLDGDVGIIGNGAGLVMSTLDVVAYAGEALPRQAVARPTSSTSAAAPRPRSWPRAWRSSSPTRRSSRSS